MFCFKMLASFALSRGHFRHNLTCSEYLAPGPGSGLAMFQSQKLMQLQPLSSEPGYWEASAIAGVGSRKLDMDLLNVDGKSLGEKLGATFPKERTRGRLKVVGFWVPKRLNNHCGLCVYMAYIRHGFIQPSGRRCPSLLRVTTEDMHKSP